MLLDHFIPRWHFREHHSLSLAASPDQALRAVKGLTPADVPLVGRLMFLRSLPSLLAGKKGFTGRKDVPFLTQITGRGFFVLGEVPEEELVLGTIGRFWKPAGEFCHSVSTPEEFLDFSEPGWVKVGWNFSAERTDAGCLLQTETRILATSRSARTKFFLYWMIVRPGSGLIRTAILRSVKAVLETKRTV